MAAINFQECDAVIALSIKPALQSLGLAYPQWLETAEQTRWDRQLITDVCALHCPDVTMLLLDQSDGFHFWAGMYAGILTGKHLLIPPNYQTGTLANLQEIYPGALRYSQLTRHRVGDRDVVLASRALDQIGLTLFTSGTSDVQGRGKSVHKHVAQMTAEAAMLGLSLPRVTRTGCVLSTVPTHHLYGLTFRGFWAFQQGLKVSLNQLENPEEIAAAVMQQAQSSQDPIVLVTTPSQLTRLPDLVGYRPLRACQTIFTAGSPLPERLAQTLAAQDIFPQEIYGSTETGALAHRRQAECRAWEPLHGVNLIWQKHQCTAQAPWINGSRPIADQLIPLPEGKFELGGRADRVVKIGEKRVDLESLETRLRQHPWVADVVVTTVQRQRLSLGALIVLSPIGLAIQKTEKNMILGQHLRLYLANTFDRVMTPKYWRYVTELPYDERGKLNQLQLRRYFDEELTSGAKSR